MDNFQDLSITIEGSVATVTLERPETRNALSPRLIDELSRSFAMLDDDRDIRVAVLRGSGPAFSGGYDLVPSDTTPIGATSGRGRGTSMAFDDDLWKLEATQRKLMTIFDMHLPVIAAVHGYCIAGGTDLALLCDIVLVAEDAKIGFPPVRSMGCPPQHLWTYLVGPQWAKRLLLTGDMLSGDDAARIGLVLDAYPADELFNEAHSLAARMALVDPHLLSANKRQVNLALELMGARTMQRLAAEIDARGHLSPSMRSFGTTAREHGMKAAVSERDDPFGDAMVRLRHAGR